MRKVGRLKKESPPKDGQVKNKPVKHTIDYCKKHYSNWYDVFHKNAKPQKNEFN